MLDRKISDLIGIRPLNKKLQPSRVINTDCCIGIEIELENFNSDDLFGNIRNSSHFNKYWNVVPDHSLRHNGQEFVLKEPRSGAGISTALKSFDLFLKKLETKPKATQTTSTHIHLDVSGMEAQGLFNFVFTYFLFEEMLLRYCGEYRRSNLYCMTFQEAGYSIETLRDLYRRPQEFQFIDGNGYKYGACNLSAVPKYGSLEFRSKGGSTSGAEIAEWINILTSIKMFAANLDTPEDLLAIASLEKEHLLSVVFGEHAGTLAPFFQEEDFWQAITDIQYIVSED